MNSQFQCFYLASWLRIKAIWDLKLAVPEAQAIQQFLQTHPCPAEIFVMNEQEYLEIRGLTDQIPDACTSLQQVRPEQPPVSEQ
jgi:hypothetical protein